MEGSNITVNPYYKEDVDNTTGTAVTTGPAVIFDITFINDTAGTITCTVHDAATASSTTRRIKAVVAANSAIHYPYPRGKKFSTAVFAKANAAGLDIALDYE